MFVQFCCTQRAIRRGKINDLIRKNQINAVRDENRDLRDGGTQFKELLVGKLRVPWLAE